MRALTLSLSMRDGPVSVHTPAFGPFSFSRCCVPVMEHRECGNKKMLLSLLALTKCSVLRTWEQLGVLYSLMLKDDNQQQKIFTTLDARTVPVCQNRGTWSLQAKLISPNTLLCGFVAL